MNRARLAYLFTAYFNKTATEAERQEFMELVQQSENDQLVKSLLSELWEQHTSESRPISDSKGQEMLVEILEEGRLVKPVAAMNARPAFRWMRSAAAAAVLLLIVAGGFMWLKVKQAPPKTAQVQKTVQPVSDAIVPGSNKAVLTLADGSRILLDSTHQGTLAKQGNADVINLSSAVLTYNGDMGNGNKAIYNTLSTPKGGQYRLVLPDGTKVWLNASSSIHFPVAFSEKERQVAITGEAYFEVAKNPAKPFKVTVRDATVQVLGTHFNIMAYDDESAMKTTLLEGSVKVSKGTQGKVITPGQQVKIMQTGAMKIAEADIEEVVAWKNGWFHFTSWDIEKIMRQIARWYDVEVVYEGKIPAGTFSGIVSRQNDIMEALEIMRGSVGFTIEGHKITVFENNR
jgi:transmembrane sensor